VLHSDAEAVPASRPETWPKSLFFERRPEGYDLPTRQVEALLDAFVQSFAEHLQQGTKIRILGLDILQVTARPPG
jgi:nucleoid DNA-binding protein